MKVLAIDFGLKRIGLAVGSSEAGIAFPRDVLLNDDQCWVGLKELVDRESIQLALVGMPLKRDGAPGDIDDELQHFLGKLRDLVEDVQVVDERYTSKMAQSKLREIGMKSKDQRDVLDSTAAQILLQEWLDQQRKAS